MGWLHTATIVVHVLLAAAIVGLVLLQRGKGADAGAGFGAGASGTVFGARGSASFLSRTTATLAALFIITSLSLAYMGGREREAPSSVLDRVQTPTRSTEEVPALPPLPATPEESSERADSAPASEETPAPAN
jgi:preprotein translocase subunit SecG